MKKLIIYGIGSHAELVYAHFKRSLKYEVVAFTVEKAFLNKSSLFELPVFPFEEIENHIQPTEAEMFVAIGPIQLNLIVKKFCDLAVEKGYSLASYVQLENQKSFLPQYGRNCFIDFATELHPFVTLGQGVTLIAPKIGHHAQIGDYSFICSATIGGNCIIENNVFIGIGAIIQQGVRIGEGSIIGMGSIIKNDVMPYSVYSVEGSKPRDIDSRKINIFKKT